MALLNNIYVFVADESVQDDVETTSHAVEKGLPISDTVRRQPVSLSLSGKIVSVGDKSAKTIVEDLKSLQRKGSLIKYEGQCGIISNLQIQSFNTNFNNKNNGGADFDMSLKEVRIAKNSFKKTLERKVKEEKVTPNIGDTVQFLGGYVYVSSDAKKAAAKRGKSVCRLTRISNLSNRKHIYHLISTDCKFGSSSYVFGWVDADRVKFLSKAVSKTSKSGGTQQTKKTNGGNKFTTISVK